MSAKCALPSELFYSIFVRSSFVGLLFITHRVFHFIIVPSVIFMHLYSYFICIYKVRNAQIFMGMPKSKKKQKSLQ